MLLVMMLLIWLLLLPLKLKADGFRGDVPSGGVMIDSRLLLGMSN
jgi:hypothetical protein